MTDEGILLQKVRIDEHKCERCYECIKACMTGALHIDKGIWEYKEAICAKCEYCMDCCSNNAIKILGV